MEGEAEENATETSTDDNLDGVELTVSTSTTTDDTDDTDDTADETVYNGQDASDFTPTREYDLGGFDVADILDSIAPLTNDDETKEDIYDYLSDSGIDWAAADDVFDVTISDVSSDGTFSIDFGQPIDPNIPSHFLFDRNKK